MFVGHLAIAFATKRVSPATPLQWFVGAAVALDLIWPMLLLAGVEQVSIRPGATAFNPLVFDSYPWSHSLLMALLWGSLLALFARVRGLDPRSAWLIGALVVSHWVLDLATHAPDLPLWPGNSPRFGFGLWQSVPATLVVEGTLWVLALLLYLQGRRAKTWKGKVSLVSLVLVCTLGWAIGPWGAPPPSVVALAWFAMILWLLLPWAAWVDRSYTRSVPEP